MNKITNIRIYSSRPDYQFSADENTALLWPESGAIRSIEHYAFAPAFTVELRIHGYEMPADADEYNEIIRSALASEIEFVED